MSPFLMPGVLTGGLNALFTNNPERIFSLRLRNSHISFLYKEWDKTDLDLVNRAQGFSAHLSQRVSNSSFASEYVTPGSYLIFRDSVA